MKRFRLVYAQAATGAQLFHRSDVDRTEEQMLSLVDDLFTDHFHRHSFPGVPSLIVFTHTAPRTKTMLVFIDREA